MPQEIDSILTSEPIRLLELFPPRKCTSVDLSTQKYMKVLSMFSCPLCKQLITNPTFLKCSHRFCKECIEKHVRTSEKKVCPICKNEPITKRNIRPDEKLLLMISCFSNSKNELIRQGFQLSEGNQNEDTYFLNQSNSRKSKESTNSNVRELKESRENDAEWKRERSDSQEKDLKELLDLNKKKSKRAKNESEEYTPPDDAKFKRKDTKELKNTQQFSQSRQLQSGEKQTSEPFELLPQQKISQANVKEGQVKDVHEQTPNNSNSEGSKTNKKQPKKKQDDLTVNSLIAESAESKLPFEANRKNDDRKDNQKVPQLRQNTNQHEEVSSQPNSKLTIQKHLSNGKVKDEILQARQLLMEHLKQSYFPTLLRKSEEMFTVPVSMVRKDSLTPPLPFSELTVSLKTKIESIHKVLLPKLNLKKVGANNPQKKVLLFEVRNQDGSLVEIKDYSIRIQSLLETFWKNYKGIKKCENFENLQQNLHSKTNRNEQTLKNSTKIIYYSIDYELFKQKSK